MRNAVRAAAGGRRLTLLLACAALSTCSLAAHAPAAGAEGVERMTGVEFERLEDLTDWVYRNGATDAAPDCEAVCTDLWLAEHRPMPNQAASSELWGELTSLEEAGATEEGVGLLPDIATAMPFGPYLSAIFLGAAAFEVGWHIGGQVDKWLGIGVPSKPTSDSYYLEWVPAGESWPFLTYHQQVAMPFSGFAVFSQHLSGIVAQSDEGGCTSRTGPSTPPDFIRLSWYWNDCFTGYGRPEAPVTAYGMVLKPEAAFPSPVQDYDGQHVDATSAPVRDPGAEVVRERLADALDSGRYPLLNQWLDHRLGGSSDDPLCTPVPGARTVRVPSIMPGQTAADYEDCLDALGLRDHVRVTVPAEQAVLAQPASGVVGVEPDEGESIGPETQVAVRANPDPLPDPSELGDPEGECEPSSGEYPVAAPPNDPTPEPFDAIDDPSIVERPTFLSLHGNTTLRWGTVIAEETFSGWGYRHIKAKHGWGRVDEAATRAALLSSVFPNRRTPDSYVFIGPEYVRDGVVCVRQVIVNEGAIAEEPEPREIATSYGRPLAPLPGYMRPR